MPGITSLSWNYQDMTTLRVFAANEFAAAIARRVLEPVVDNVQLTLWIDGQKAPYSGTATSSLGDAIHAVAAMPGVWNYSYHFTPLRGQATFDTVSKATIDRLDPIIRNTLEVGPDQFGNPRTFHILWRAGVPNA